MWETPALLFSKLDAEFNFTIDVCATALNTKCKNFFSLEEDGLKQEWTGKVWCNPPYGRDLGKWIEKAYESVRRSAKLVCCLVPSRTDTAWWHDFVQPYAKVRFIRGRIKFAGTKTSAPFPSALAIFQQGRKAW